VKFIGNGFLSDFSLIDLAGDESSPTGLKCLPAAACLTDCHEELFLARAHADRVVTNEMNVKV
jgi:hypothetical protein